MDADEIMSAIKGRAYLNAGKYGKAVGLLRSATTSDVVKPVQADLYRMLGDAYYGDKNYSAAKRAYEMAGIGPKDLDFVELHDCFSIAEIIDSEDLGLMPRGHGGGGPAPDVRARSQERLGHSARW